MRSKSIARTYRLLLGFFSPSILGSILFLVLALAKEISTSPLSFDRVYEYLAQIHVVIFFAFIFVGIQSLVFSLVMEFVVRPKVLELNKFLLVSCILGFLSGFIPGMIVDDLGLFLPGGSLVGILSGLLIYDRDVKVDKGNA